MSLVWEHMALTVAHCDLVLGHNQMLPMGLLVFCPFVQPMGNPVALVMYLLAMVRPSL